MSESIRSKITARRFSKRHMKNVQKTALIVLDIGETLTKAGFAGETEPRSIYPTQFRSPKNAKMEHIFSKGMHRYTVKEWTRMIRLFVQDLFFLHLQTNPVDRKVLILESPHMLYNFKSALVHIMFELGVPGILFLPAQLVSMYSTNISDGLIVDVGFGETRVLPISNQFPCRQAPIMSSLGMREVIAYFRELMDAESKEDSAKEITDRQYEDIITRCAYVRESGNENVPASFRFQVSNENRCTILGKPRAVAADALFGENEEQLSVATQILDTVVKCPREVRGRVIGNVVLCGGSTLLPGFGHRLVQELDKAFDDPRYSELENLRGKLSFKAPSFQPHILAWVGGSIIGTFDLDEDIFLQPKQFSLKNVIITITEPHEDGKGTGREKYAIDRDSLGNGVPDWSVNATFVEREELLYATSSYTTFLTSMPSVPSPFTAQTWIADEHEEHETF